MRHAILSLLLLPLLFGCRTNAAGERVLDHAFVEQRLELTQRQLEVLAQAADAMERPHTAAKVRELGQVLASVEAVFAAGVGGDEAADSVLQSIDLARSILEEVIVAFVDDPERQQRIRLASIAVGMLLEEAAFWLRRAEPAENAPTP